MDSLTSGTRQVIKVLLADDHQLFREGLKRILNMEEDIEVVGECGDGAQVLESCLQLQPEIVLMDINMPLLNGVDATAELREALPDVKVIILSIHDDESYVFETLRKGATGYLLKDMEAESLINAIRTVAEGNAFIHPKVTGKLIQQLRRMEYLSETGAIAEDTAIREAGVKFVAGDDNPLTRREAEVLRLMAEGRSNKMIGEHLFISEKTVKNHVSSILQKMDVDDRTQAVINAIKFGWVTL
ncbi:response regulator transcription factor [Paenibacillus phoenicis]|uniref:Two-component system, NarL family, response regulator DegU n=3 Tax=Paenibacillus TaxID=44249 RepID=R9L6T6_9BACL|nr:MULTISPECIES: response regulator transcription factor [Paenibacillus]EES72664.1 putative oxygen regulatory protein NreC [Paenibacillus sp. oral taxon 786 str. D14]EOS54126.1 two-component system, NarL family, response regulator DegU [Paenibacillus barengoltzii G22]MDU0331139.1 response regulator transcription factor [Paenibacillus sp. 3LSP]MEA3571372.1 response regulator transcription factor [Paenibacillus phoenicis]MEC2346346.1 response regulator transcription factor [Paenibacillus barengo